MTPKTVAIILFPLWGLGVGVAAAKGQDQTTGPAAGQQMLIEPDQLLKTLHKPNVRILDVRSENDYARGHIPGAVRVDVRAWRNLATADQGLHDATAWTQKVSQLGLRPPMRVVVYGSRLSDTARIWWLLKYVGVSNASILDGGWQAWSKNDQPVETSTPQVRPSEFKPQFQADRLAEIDSVKKSLNSETVKVVDTRSDREFDGGRIPGAAHLEWTELVTEDGRFKTQPQLRELFRSRGIVPAETAVCY